MRYELSAWRIERFERHERDTARYYEAHMAQDLWGQWIVRTVWGGVGSARADGVTR